MVFPQPVDEFLRRCERAESWAARAQREVDATPPDYDAAFVFFWFAFNALYAHETLDKPSMSARRRYREFLRKLLSVDRRREIESDLYLLQNDIVAHLIDNHYVYLPFWEDVAGIRAGRNWERRFARSQADYQRYLRTGEIAFALGILFERLYDLRNQLMHGGARHGSPNNRRQVVVGARVMARLAPVFITLMRANPVVADGWGNLDYPPIHDPDEPMP